MKGAPESVGLAWLAVKSTLSAIQGNYELYTFFGTGLTDITEIMVLIPHYDRLYDETFKPNWKGNPIVEKLFNHITKAYIAVLSFSFAIKRHISTSPLARIGHVISDFFGASELKFHTLLDNIGDKKTRVLEDSMAVFQEKSLGLTVNLQEAVGGLVSKVNEVRDFQVSIGTTESPIAAGPTVINFD